jgi:hypothetical protein
MDYSRKQKQLDSKKWVDSEIKGYDTCGEYEYCSNCNKSEKHPCAHAYETYSAIAKLAKTTTTKTTKTATKKTTSSPKVTTTTTTKTYTKSAPAREEYYEETVYDNDQLSDMLKDITDRYSELDFSDNSDIDKKVELIKDIEVLIEDETRKGEGLNSRNADIRQIFVELQNIVDDMKNAL